MFYWMGPCQYFLLEHGPVFYWNIGPYWKVKGLGLDSGLTRKQWVSDDAAHQVNHF